MGLGFCTAASRTHVGIRYRGKKKTLDPNRPVGKYLTVTSYTVGQLRLGNCQGHATTGKLHAHVRLQATVYSTVLAATR